VVEEFVVLYYGVIGATKANIGYTDDRGYIAVSVGKAVMNVCRTNNGSLFSASKGIHDEYQTELLDSVGSSSLLQQAERYLLQKRYKEALFSVNQAFVRLPTTRDTMLENPRLKEAKKVVLLSPSLKLPSRRRAFQFSVSLYEPENQTEKMDLSQQLAVIGLQSWHELSSRDKMEQESILSLGTGKAPFLRKQAWKHLEPILNYFDISQDTIIETKSRAEEHVKMFLLDLSSCRTLSLDLLSMWIPFWEAHGYEKEAFGWATQILRAISTRIHSEDPYGERRMTKNEETIWLYYVSHQLPHIKDFDFAHQMLHLTTTASGETSEVGIASAFTRTPSTS
jgi:hypothetical protein